MVVRVFLSHAHADRDWARHLASELQQRGLDVWLDSERQEPGQRRDEALRKAIDEADACLVVFSRAADPSDPSETLLSKEWSAIQESRWERPHLPIYPIQLGDADVPPFLRRWQALRFPEPIEEIEAAADRIAVLVGRVPPQPGETDVTRERFAAEARFARLERALAKLKAVERAGKATEFDG